MLSLWVQVWSGVQICICCVIHLTRLEHCISHILLSVQHELGTGTGLWDPPPLLLIIVPGTANASNYPSIRCWALVLCSVSVRISALWELSDIVFQRQSIRVEANWARPKCGWFSIWDTAWEPWSLAAGQDALPGWIIMQRLTMDVWFQDFSKAMQTLISE